MKVSVTSLPELLNWSEKCIHAVRSLTGLPVDRSSTGMLPGCWIVLTHNTAMSSIGVIDHQANTVKMKSSTFSLIWTTPRRSYFLLPRPAKLMKVFLKTVIHQECCSIFETI